jgi:16S rRNA (adenine1518-N6/adenine1519-N6)-dimethyltransferase
MSSESLKQQARAFHTKKRLGQNFLINPDILAQITRALAVQPGDHVLEIGPGLGFLTAVLLGSGARVTAVELDEDCVKALEELSLPGLTVIHQDFLQCDLKTILEGKTKVIGNVPYQITTPILVRLLGEIGEPAPWLKSIESIVLTVQREVGERFVAKVGEDDYSQISVLVRYFAAAEMLFTVAPENFYPVPEVTSAVVKFIPHAEIPVSCTDHKLLRQVVAAGFQQRRKMLKNNLSFIGLDQKQIMDVFNNLNFDPQVRAERLGLDQFALLADALKAAKAKNIALSV